MRTLRLATVLLALAAPLAAADFVVTRYDDPFPDGCAAGDCSLREATLAANDSAGSDRVRLSAGTYELTRFGLDDVGLMGDLDLTDEIELIGPAATMTRIDAAALGSVQSDSAISVFDTATLRGLTIAGSVGDGVRVVDGTLVMERCEVRENDFQGNSAGVRSLGNSTLTIRDSAIINNGIGLNGVGGTFVLENVTFNSNQANQIIVQQGSSLTCTHCTIVDTVGGNGEVRVGGSTAEFANSIVRGNCALDPGGLISSSAGNVESPGHGCGFTLAGDRDDVADPGLSVLGDHGGATRTFDLAIGSPALALVEASECLLQDQRGVARSFHLQTPCDAGAVERVTSRVPTPLFVDGVEQGHPGAWSAVVGD